MFALSHNKAILVVQKIDILSIIPGTEQEVKVEKIIMHERYNAALKQEDIAIAKLSEPARISDHIETICLPKATEERELGSKCMISGKKFNV